MRGLLVLQLLLVTVGLALSAVPKCMFFGFPEVNYDGVDRSDVITEKLFNKTVFAEGAKSVVFFSDVEADDPELDQYECFLQLSAQVMEKRGYKFYTVNTTKEVKLAKQEDVEDDEDTIHVYQGGYQIEYFGIRDPSTFVEWLMDVPDEPLTILNTKEDKRDFDEMDDETTRVIGWFEPGSKELKEFEEAAEEFMGEVEFFAVVDKFWAKRMGLKEVGDVLMWRPFEKEPIEAPDSADTEDEFEDWVEKNKDPVLQELTEFNYFDVWQDPEEDEFMIVAFADDEEPEGRALNKLLKKMANKFSDKAGTLEIVMIDPGEFPLMIDVWENMFGIEIEEEPQIGLVDISEHEGIWLDMSLLNLDDPKKYEEENEDVLERWIEQILNGTISLDEDDEPEPPPPPPPPKGKAKKKEL